MSNLVPPPPRPQPPETPPWDTPSSIWYTPRTTPWRTPQSTQSTPLNQMVLTKPTVKFNGIDAEPRKDTVILRQPRNSKTNLWIWCVACLCFVFSLLLIFFGIATLILFLAIRPRTPVFDIPSANLHTLYFDPAVVFNGDLSMLVNFTNPNNKIELRYEKLQIELFFFNRLIAAQAVLPFKQRKHETRLEPIRLISTLVCLPVNHAVELMRQVQNNQIDYEIRVTFKVIAHFGMIHYSYSLHGRCQLQMTAPPTGNLSYRNCTTKRQ